MRISDWSSDVCSSDLRAEVVERFQIAARADDIFGFGEFEAAAAAFLVGAFERVCHLRRRYAKGGELLRIDDDLILAHHAADARDLGAARNRFEFEADRKSTRLNSSN